MVNFWSRFVYIFIYGWCYFNICSIIAVNLNWVNHNKNITVIVKKKNSKYAIIIYSALKKKKKHAEEKNATLFLQTVSKYPERFINHFELTNTNIVNLEELLQWKEKNKYDFEIIFIKNKACLIFISY